MRRTLGLAVALATGAMASSATATEQSCVVPRLKGDTLTQAAAALARASCRIGRTTGPTNGRVVSQSPRPGRREKHDARVALKFEAVGLPAPRKGQRPTLLEVAVNGGVVLNVYPVTATLYAGSTRGGPVNGEPLTFTIADATAHRSVETFKGTSGATCVIRQTIEPGNTARFYAAAQGGCGMAPVAGPASDTYTVTATFRGSAKWAASSSSPEPLAP